MRRQKKQQLKETFLSLILAISVTMLWVLHPVVWAEETSALDIASVLPSVGFFPTTSHPDDLITMTFKTFVDTDDDAEPKYFLIDTGVSEKYTMVYIANYVKDYLK